MMNAFQISALKLFVEKFNSNPSILHNPSLAFFKSFLESLGAQIPPDVKAEGNLGDISRPSAHVDVKREELSDGHEYLEDDFGESDIELEDAVLAGSDVDTLPKMGDPSIEVSEEDRDAAQGLKSSAMDAISEGKLNEALDLLTKGIIRNPHSAILYASRAGVFIKLNKPKAALRDAGAASQMNPDNAKGHKMMGIARTMLGQWEVASRDLHMASKLDHDEEIESFLKKAESNARKVEEHHEKPEKQSYEKARQTEGKKQNSNTQDEDAACGFKKGQVIEIESSADFDARVDVASQAAHLVVLYFTAAWCGPCRYIAPIFAELAGKHWKAVFVKVDLDKAPEKGASWRIRSIPTFFFLKDGKVVDEVIGADTNLLEIKITQHACNP